MLESISERKPYGVEEFLSPRNLEHADAAVVEIFNLMFGFDIEAVEVPGIDPTAPGQDDRTAIVGFSGAMRGSCQVRMGTPPAQAIASAMLGGTPVAEDDDSIDDALGELCNMLAGGWKNSIPGLSSECALSPPTVISGRDYKVHTCKPSEILLRAYRFDIHTFLLTLCREETGRPQGNVV
jgi:chemotaxis protein CheX